MVTGLILLSMPAVPLWLKYPRELVRTSSQRTEHGGLARVLEKKTVPLATVLSGDIWTDQVQITGYQPYSSPLGWSSPLRHDRQ